MFKTSVFETVTGKFIANLDGNVSTWARELNGTDTATVQLTPGAITLATRGELRNVTEPWRMSLAVLWDDIPIVYGPIITRQWDGKGLKINVGSIKLLLARRKAHMWGIPYNTQTLTYTNLSLGSIAVALVRDVAEAVAKAGSGLPIVFPSDIVDLDPTHQRTYPGTENKDITSLLDDLSGVLNGPDIDFLAGWTDATHTYMQYTMRVGTPTAPMLIQPNQLVFDATQPDSAVKSVSYIEDGSQLATTQWAAGAGMDTGTVMSKATSLDLVTKGWPLLEGEKDYKTVENQATLDTYSAGDLATNQTPTVQWGMVIDAEMPPSFGTYQIGDIGRVRIKNHVWIPDNDNYLVRIIMMSGTGAATVTLGVQGFGG
jgi:hypothetical protein